MKKVYHSFYIVIVLGYLFLDFLLQINVTLGISLYFIIVLTSLYHLTKKTSINSNTLTFLVILPFIRIIMFGVNLSSPFWIVLLSYGLIFLTVVAYAHILGMKSVKRRYRFHYIILVILLGLNFGMLEGSSLDYSAFPLSILWFPLLALVAYTQEFVHRRFVQSNIAKKLGENWGIIYTAFIVTISGAFLHNFYLIILIFSENIISGIFYSESRQLRYSVLLNWIINITLLLGLK